MLACVKIAAREERRDGEEGEKFSRALGSFGRSTVHVESEGLHGRSLITAKVSVTFRQPQCERE